MSSYRTGKSYRRRQVHIRIANPAAHRIQGRINQLKREIEQASEMAAHFNQLLPVWVEHKEEMLDTLERQLEKVTQ